MYGTVNTLIVISCNIPEKLWITLVSNEYVSLNSSLHLPQHYPDQKRFIIHSGIFYWLVTYLSLASQSSAQSRGAFKDFHPTTPHLADYPAMPSFFVCCQNGDWGGGC